jgi:hypothetical protein
VRRYVEKLACYKALHEEEEEAAVQLRLDKLFSKVEKPPLQWKEQASASAASCTDSQLVSLASNSIINYFIHFSGYFDYYISGVIVN